MEQNESFPRCPERTDLMFQEKMFGGTSAAIFSVNHTLWIHPSYNGQNMWFMVQAFAYLWIIYGVSTVFRTGE